MDNIQKLIVYIEDEIKNVKKMIATIKNHQIDENLENVILKIKDVIIDHRNILYITQENLECLKNICDEELIYNLEGYNAFLLTGVHLSESSIQVLNKFCDEILLRYEFYKKENSVDTHEMEKLNKKFDKLKSLHYKLTDTYELKANDIDLVISILKQNNITEEEIIEYIIFISCQFMRNLQKYNFEEVNIIEEKISLEEIIELFNSYNYDFNAFNNKQKETILTKGNLNNIKGILEVFYNHNINLNEPFNSKTILTGRSAQLCEIFVHSSPELVLSVLDLAKTKIKLYDGKNIDFALLLERPGIFINKRRNSKKENKESIDFSGNDVCGCHEDFINNVNTIYNKYIEVYGSDKGFDMFFRKSKLACVFEASHKKIKNIINTLEMYGFETKEYLRALSSFNSNAHADVLDVAIELGCYDYIKDNPSRLIKAFDSDVYTKLAVLRMCHISNELIFREKTRTENNEQYIVLNDQYINYFINLNKEKLTPFLNFDDFSFRRFKLEDNYDDIYLKLFADYESKIESNETTSFNLAIKDLEQEDSVISKLEKYVCFNDPMVYEINGIRVSKNKVLRLYHILKLNNYLISSDFMIYIMSRNSYLTQEQFEILSSGIVEIIEQGEKTV